MRKYTRKTVLQLSLLSSALLLAAPVALAQDSGLGTDLHFGTALDTSGGTALLGCAPDGATWLTAQRKRTPTGFLYPDRNSVVQGKRVSVRVDLRGPRLLNKKKNK